MILVECLFTTEVRRCSLDIDFYFDGDKYDAGGVELGRMASGIDFSVDRAKVTLANADRSMSAILLANNERGKTVNVYAGAIDADAQLVGSGHLYRGLMSTYDIGDDTVVLHLVSEMILWKKQSARRSGDGCPWPYGSDECGHSGSWCDQTYDRCASLGNTDNFGGNRFLPALQEKKIWWGRVRK